MADQSPPRFVRGYGRFKVSGTVDRADLYSGLFFIAVAVFGLFASRDFTVGTAVNMGEGYVPRMICWILIGIGAVITVKSFLHSSANEAEPLAWRPIVFVLASVVAFALTVEKLGLLISIPLMIGIGSFAGRNMRPVEIIATAFVLCLGTIAIFSWGLGLTIPVLPRF